MIKSVSKNNKLSINFALDTILDFEQQIAIVSAITLWLKEYQEKMNLDDFMLSYFHSVGYPDWFDIYKSDVILRIV